MERWPTKSRVLEPHVVQSIASTEAAWKQRFSRKVLKHPTCLFWNVPCKIPPLLRHNITNKILVCVDFFFLESANGLRPARLV